MAYDGDKFLLKVTTTGSPGGLQTVLTARATDLNIGIERVDTSHKGTSGWRTYKSTFKSFSVTLDGVFEHEDYEKDLAAYAHATPPTEFAAELVNEVGETWSGTMVITSYGRSGAYDGIETYSMTIENAGPITYTPAP